MIKFSIIIPAYNSSNYILKTLTSVKQQSYKNFEIVLTDDGSIDPTVDVVERFKDENPELSILINKQGNKGIGAARNASFHLSTGNALAFLDDDDIWYPERLEEIAKYMNKHPHVDVVSHRVYKRYPDNTKRILPTSIPKKDLFESLLLKGNTLAISATVVQREAFVKVGYFSEEVSGAEDYELWLKLAYQGFRFGFVPQFLGEYTRRPGGFSLARIPVHLASVLSVIDKYGLLLISNHPEKADRIKKAIRSRKVGETISSIIKLCRQGNFKAAKPLLQNIFR